MFKRTLQLLLISTLVTPAVWAGADSFVGDWKLNPAKCTYIDRMKVESIDANQYSFDFGGGPEKIVADGTDQPGIYGGTMLSVTLKGPGSWTVVRKKDGRMMLSATWQLAPDGDSLNDSYTDFAPDGSSSTMTYLYKRTAPGRGFAGTWESPIPLPASSAFVLQIRPYEGNGLSLIRSPQDTRNLSFDGKDHPVANAAEGATRSARRINERTLEITDKSNGKITKTERVELSRDLKTLTRTVRPAGQRDPNVFVFERQ